MKVAVASGTVRLHAEDAPDVVDAVPFVAQVVEIQQILARRRGLAVVENRAAVRDKVRLRDRPEQHRVRAEAAETLGGAEAVGAQLDDLLAIPAREFLLPPRQPLLVGAQHGTVGQPARSRKSRAFATLLVTRIEAALRREMALVGAQRDREERPEIALVDETKTSIAFVVVPVAWSSPGIAMILILVSRLFCEDRAIAAAR